MQCSAKMRTIVLAVSLSLSMAACGGQGSSSNSGGNPQPTLSSITVTPASVTLIAGQTQQLTATASFSDSSTKDVTSSVVWFSSNTAIASISSTGLMSSVAAGQVNISAAMSGVSATDAVTIKAKTLTSISVSPVSATIAQGISQRYTATGLYNDGTMADVTQSATWSSSSTSTATIASQGLVTTV